MLIFPKYEKINKSLTKFSFFPENVSYSLFQRSKTKYNLICKPSPHDKIAFILLEEKLRKINDYLPDNLFSFIKGKSHILALKSASHYISQWGYNKNGEGLYIFKTDIKNYGDSIPLDNSSSLWDTLEKLSLKANIVAQQSYNDFENQIKRCLRLKTKQDDGYESQACCGAPFGLSLTNIITNIYLNPLDEHFGSKRNSDIGYFRYGDDILLVSNERGYLLEEVDNLKRIIANLRLSINDSKTSKVYLNSTGKLFSDDFFIGRDNFPYLGQAINFKGGLEIRQDKLSDLFKNLRYRLRNLSKITASYAPDKAGKMLCEFTNDFFSSSEVGQNLFFCKACIVTSKSQIKDIDFKIRKMIVTALTKNNSVKEMRKYSKVKLMQEWKLKSIKSFILTS